MDMINIDLSIVRRFEVFTKSKSQFIQNIIPYLTHKILLKHTLTHT